MPATDPLASLLIDEDDVAREELAAGLAPYVQITRQGGLMPLPAFEGLTAADKVLALLLSVKAMKMLGLRDGERVGPAELIELSGMPGGTVRPKLSSLVKKRLIIKDDHEYWITTLGSRKALEALVASNG
jgi:hypothetical protein